MGARGPVVFAAALDVPSASIGLASALIMLGCQVGAAAITQALAPTLVLGLWPTGLALAIAAAISYPILPRLASRLAGPES